MTRSGGPDEAMSNVTTSSKAAGTRPGGQDGPVDQPRMDRSDDGAGQAVGNARPAASMTPQPHGPLHGDRTPRTEQLALDGIRPDRSLGAPTVIGRTATRPAPPRQRPQAERSRVRRARLRAVRLDPWSVMKTAFLLSIAFAIVTVVAVTVVWKVLEAAGVYESVNNTVRDVLGSASQTTFDLEQYIGLERVLGITALVCVVDVVLITAIATLAAFLYNLSASLLGGLEVTLAEDE